MSDEKQYMDMSNEEEEGVSKGVYKKFLKLFEGAYIKPYELYLRFRDDYINNLVDKLSGKYKGVARERIKAIVLESYLDETYRRTVNIKVIRTHYKALEEVFKEYLSSYIHIDLSKIENIVKKETGQKLTKEDIDYYKEVLTKTAMRNQETLIENYPELYMVYYKNMHNELIKHLKNIAVSAEIKLNYENARSFLRKYLTEQEIKLLDESPYHIFEIAEAIKKGRLDELCSKLQERVKSQEHIEPTKEDKISFYQKLLDLVIYLKERLGDEQAPWL